MFHRLTTAAVVLAAACAPACSDGSEPPVTSKAAVYVVGSSVFGPEGNNSYVNVIGSLDEQTLDYSKAYEFPGSADLWVWNNKVFIADGESPVIRRYAVDDAGALALESEISFAVYGLADAAFWNAIWVSPSKAYMANGQGEYVIWDPLSTPMTITGTMPHPPLADRGIQKLRPASTDRGVVVSGNRLYHPYYWADDSYTSYADDSRIAIYDTTTDQLIDVVEAGCTGLDIATQDGAGNLYFSNWTGNVGLSLVHRGAPPCGAKIAAGTTAIDGSWTLSWPEVTDGRSAAALRYSGDGHALLSVFYSERTPFDDSTDPWTLVGSENWRIWRVDLQTRTAAPLDSIAWNSGATYLQRIDDLTYVLVPSADYSTSTVYAVDGATATPRFQTTGWGIRLFRVR